MKWATYIFMYPNYGFYVSINCPFDYYLRQSKYVRILFFSKLHRNCHVEFLQTRTIPYCLSPKCLGECDVTLTQVHVFQEGRKNPPPVKLLHTFLASQKPIHKSQFMYHYIYERINFHYEDKQYQFP